MLLMLGFAEVFAAEPGRNVSLTGIVTEQGTDIPVIGAAVRLGEDYLWTTTDLDGKFSLNKIQPGTYVLEVACLG